MGADISGCGIGFWRWEIREQSVQWSSDLRRIFGIGETDEKPICLTKFAQFVHPDDRARVIATVSETLATCRSSHAHIFRIIRPDGAVRLLFSRADLVCDEEGRPEALAGVDVDLTGIEQDALMGLPEARSADRFERMPAWMQHVGVGTYTWNVPEDRLVWSPELQKLFGITTSPDVEHGFLEFIHPDDRVRVEAEITRYMGAGDTYAHEFRIVQHDGTVRVIHDRGVIERATDGSARLFRGVNIDVTSFWTFPGERKDNSSPTGHSAWLKTAFEAAGMAAWDLDLRTGQAIWTPRLYALLGLSTELPASGDAFFQRVHPDDRDHVRQSLETSIATGTLFEQEFRIVRSDGTVRHLAGTGRVVEWSSGEPVRMIGVNYDVTGRKTAELAELASGRLLQTVLACTPDLVWAKDREGRMTLGNAATLALLGGGDPSKVLGLDTHALIPDPLQAQGILENDERIMSSGRPETVEERLGHGTAERIYQSVKVPLRDESGVVIGIVGISRDVTEQERVARALRNSEARLRRATEAGRLAVLDVEDPGAGCEAWASDNFRMLYGLAPDDPIQFDIILDRIHPDDRDRVVANHRRLAVDGGAFTDQIRICLPGGGVRWLHIVGEAEPAADSDMPTRIRAVNVDVTEVKEAEERLRASEEQFRSIYQHAGTAIALAGLDGRLQSCNPACQELLGYAPEELTGHGLLDLVHPDDREQTDRLLLSLLDEEVTSIDRFTRCLRKDGATIWVQEHISLVKDASGRPSSILALVTDMTERRHSEEHLKLLLNEVNHRSQNILALVQVIARQSAARDPQGFLERFEERIDSLSQINILLVRNSWRQVFLEDLVRTQLAHMADTLGTRIHIGGPKVTVAAHAAQSIGMALYELATNAAKYGALSTSDGKVDLHWDTQQLPGGQILRISWTERDGPPVQPPSREGFGSLVMGRVIRSALQASVEIDYAPAGLCWRMEFRNED